MDRREYNTCTSFKTLIDFSFRHKSGKKLNLKNLTHVYSIVIESCIGMNHFKSEFKGDFKSAFM